jgi:hypothetical protein
MRRLRAFLKMESEGGGYKNKAHRDCKTSVGQIVSSVDAFGLLQRRKPVPAPPFRADVFGIAGINLEFLPEIANIE